MTFKNGRLYSDDGRYFLHIQNDGNTVSYAHDGRAIWNSGPDKHPELVPPLPTPPEPPIPPAVTLDPLHATGRTLYAGDRPFQLRAITEFDLGHLARTGNTLEVARRMDRAKVYNRNVLRVLMMARTMFDLSPTMPGYWEARARVELMAHERGLRVEWTVFADARLVMPNAIDRSRFLDAAWASFSRADLVGIGNELRCNDNWTAAPTDPEILSLADRVEPHDLVFSISDPDDVTTNTPYPGDPLKADLATLAAHSPMLVLHGERKLRDARWSGWCDHLKGFAEVAWDCNRVLYHQEPMGAASTYIDGKRDNRPLAHLAASLVCAVMQMGYCYHYISAADDTVPGLDLCAAAALVPVGPEWMPRNAGTGGACVVSFSGYDKIRTCDNGTTAWAVGYGHRTGAVEWAAGWHPITMGEWRQVVDGQEGAVTLWTAARG